MARTFNKNIDYYITSDEIMKSERERASLQKAGSFDVRNNTEELVLT
jgi:hypothetical protein